ncbi:hypothetical protein L611_000500000410 [Aminobacter sp. J15]|nr:hypothetical protein L610_002500000420 [Aminobacter sp. J44]TWH27211.1 hypothetical protein L611_000500000410 [Aminobacter sp. J15]
MIAQGSIAPTAPVAASAFLPTPERRIPVPFPRPQN